MKMYSRSGGITPCILDLGTRWRFRWKCISSVNHIGPTVVELSLRRERDVEDSHIEKIFT